MSHDNLTPDGFADRNMTLIGKSLHLPPRADAARAARWIEDRTGAAQATRPHSRHVTRRRATIAFIGLAAAASVVVAVWLGSVATPPVSAAEIFRSFQEALGRKLTITVEGIDLDNVTVDGEIILDRNADEPNEETDTLYTELKVVLKADNPAWNDLDGAVVVCQSPEQSWRYCRGNGLTNTSRLTGVKRVEPTEFFLPGSNWQTFANAPLDDFLAMPGGLSACDWEDCVHYCFYGEQREYLQNLTRFLLRLTEPGESAAMIDELQDAAGTIEVERQDADTMVLYARNFEQVDWFFPPAPEIPEIPDKDETSRSITWELTYDREGKHIEVTHWSGIAEPWTLDSEAYHALLDSVPTDSVKEMVAHLKLSAREVSVTRARTMLFFGRPRWKVRVIGYPLPLKISDGYHWAAEVMPGLMRDLELTLFYDTETETVSLAEFTNVAGPGSRITLEPGVTDLDPDRLDPSRWITPQTWDLSGPTGGEN